MNHVDPVYTQKGFNRLMFVLTILGGIVWIVCIALWAATARPTELLSEFVGEAPSEGGYSSELIGAMEILDENLQWRGSDEETRWLWCVHLVEEEGAARPPSSSL